MVETKAIVCGHIFRNERDIALVVRHFDGDWQLVCGGHDHPEDCSDFEVVGLEHLVERQPNLIDIAWLAPGQMAERETDGWKFSSHDD